MCAAPPFGGLAPSAVQAQSGGRGATDPPLYEGEPFDLIILNDDDQTEMRVFPVAELPIEPKPSDKLIVRRIENPGEELEVQWYAINRFLTFGQLVLAQARAQAAANDFAGAYDTFAYLRQFYPSLEGLDAALDDTLLLEAQRFSQQGDPDRALASAYALFERAPMAAGLEPMLAAILGAKIDQYVAEGDYRSARLALSEIERRYPDGESAVPLRARLTETADRLVQSAVDLHRRGDSVAAYDDALTAVVVWPQHRDARRLLTQMHDESPRVTVGVTSGGGPTRQGISVAWGAGRDDRLLERRLMEFVGYGADGGKYESPIGDAETANLGRRIELRLNEGVGGADAERALTAYEVSRRMLELTRPDSPDWDPQWTELLGAVEVGGPYELAVDFARAHVHPAALLQRSPYALGSDRTALAPYVVRHESAEDRLLTANDAYVAAEEGQPQAIVERRFANMNAAVEALQAGWLSLVDRVPPWSVAELRRDPQLVVEPYQTPTIHCLIPNLNRPLPADRTFRRALLYGVNRQSILDQQLLRGQTMPGCFVQSGPFARGASLSDAMGYAYDDRIDPRPYDPRLAMTLVDVVRLTRANAAKEEDGAAEPPAEESPAAGDEAESTEDNETPESTIPPLPPLVLAHPANDVARAACQAIQRHWELIGVQSELREIPADEPVWLSPDDDFLYAELTMREPLVDARRLLGPEGVLGSFSPYMSVALRDVDEATSWAEAREALQRVHRTAHDETTVIPLWQLAEHLAYHDSLSGVGAEPAELYQQVESWRQSLRLPEAPQ